MCLLMKITKMQECNKTKPSKDKRLTPVSPSIFSLCMLSPYDWFQKQTWQNIEASRTERRSKLDAAKNVATNRYMHSTTNERVGWMMHCGTIAGTVGWYMILQ